MNLRVPEADMKKILFILFFIIMFQMLFYAEELLKEGVAPVFDTLGREEGLTNLSVSSLVQDKYGFIWIGTQGGLNKYDGRKIEVIKNNPFSDNGLLHNLIQTMYYDEENNFLWIGTYQGLSKYIIDRNIFENYTVENNGLSNPVVVAIEKDNEGNLWIGTLEGLNVLNIETGNIKKYEIPGNTVRSVKYTSEGEILIGTYTGLYRYNKINDNVEKIELKLPSELVMSVKEFQEGIISLGLWNGGLYEYNTKTLDYTLKTFKDNRIYVISQTTDGIKWVGTWGGGLFAVTPDNKEYNFSGEGPDKYLPHPIVYSLMQDSSGIFWIGTNGGGMSKLNPRKINYMKYSHNSDDENSLSAGKIAYITKDSYDNLWVAVYNSGINVFSPDGTIKKYRYDPENLNSLPDDNIRKIEETENGNMIIATGRGIVLYNREDDSFELQNILPDGTIVYSFEKDGNYLWIGTYSDGLFRYNTVTKDLKRYYFKNSDDYTISDNLVYAVLKDSKGRLWVGTNNGLNMMPSVGDNFKIFKRVHGDREKISWNTIHAIFEDSFGRIWIGMTGGGIAYYNEDGTFTNFTEEEGLSSNYVNGIAEGTNGDIWASTHNGISLINKENEITILTPGDGIGSWEFNFGGFKDKDGNIYFGSTNGITVIPDSFKEKNIDKPKLYITDAELFQKEIDKDKAFYNNDIKEFSYNENYISFRFTAIDYDTPEKTKFYYYLKGFEKSWIYLGTGNYISYSNLPPGKYELLAYAETMRGIKSDIVHFYFTIRKPWFQTVYAYILYLMAVILLVYGMIKIWEGRIINIKNSELAVINEKLEEANRTLENLSVKDPLTETYNRRYFDTMIREYISLAKRSKIYLSVIMIDIDDFKKINDSYGHLAGDYLLKDFGLTIKRALPRTTDFVARYGGDEFIVSLFDTNPAGALVVAENIKKSLEHTRIRQEFSKNPGKVTISLGVYSSVPPNEFMPEDYIEKADRALYIAKHNGKNNIKVFNG